MDTGHGLARFEQSVKAFEEFLGNCGCPAHVVWVRPKDVLFAPQRRVYVRQPLPPSNEEHARRVFAEGMQTKLGVQFGTICLMENVTCCYAWAPANTDEAEGRLMPEGLKMSATSGESRQHGKAVKNVLLWRWLEWKHRKLQQNTDWLFS